MYINYNQYLYYKINDIYEDLCHGWHFIIRFTASKDPLKTPCSKITSIAYAEHVGWNLQDDGNKGEMKYL